MSNDDIELSEILALIDTNSKQVWEDLSENDQKIIKKNFFILNRYISNVRSNDPDIIAHFILTTNEYYNKNWNDLQKHPQLLWQLLCNCALPSKKIMYHEWISMKKRSSTKVDKFLGIVYPNSKEEDIKIMAKVLTITEIKDLARSYGYDEKQIKSLVQ